MTAHQHNLLTLEQATERAQKLRAIIDDYRYHYHVLDESTMSEAAADSLKHELTRLEEQAALVAAMRCLTDGERRILRLIFWEERTQAEAARLLQVSQQAIAKTKKRALAKLRAAFRSEGDGSGALCPAPA